MSWLMAIFLGFVQGLTEFIPVSSSGHLALFQAWGLENIEERHLFFDVLLHMGTLVAVCLVYKKDIKDMISAVMSLFRGGRDKDGYPIEGSKLRLVFLLVLGTLPLALILPFQGMIEGLGNRMWFVGLMLLITGGFLFFSDKLVQGRKGERQMTVKNALLIGLLQCIGTLPGISRSGITITGGLMGGLNRSFAVRYSFLLSLPAIFGANIITLFRSFSDVDWSLLPRYLVGVLVAGVTGYFAIHLVKILVESGRFGKFAYYCWGLGILAIIFSFF